MTPIPDAAPRTAGRPMDPAISAHLDHMRLRGLSAATITCRRNALTRMTATLGPLPGVTPAALLAWRAGLEVTPEVAAHYITHAREFYRWATATGLCQDNPAAGLPVPKTSRRLPRPIPERDLMDALDAAPPRIRLWLVLAAWCGLRAKEIALLRSRCIMATAARPVILVAADATKGRSERTVPLCSFAVAEIAAARLPATGWAFRRHDGLPGPNSPSLVSKLASEHLHACGIAATLHQLRHRFGTETYETSGHDLLAVGAMMGHASPSTTAMYAAWSQTGAAGAVEALPVPRRLRATG